MLTLRLALRNLGRRRGRTALTIMMLFVCTGLVVFSTGLAEGSYKYMIRVATDTWSGQAELMAPGYEASPSLFETIADPESEIAHLESHGEVVAATPRVETAGLLSAGNRTVGLGLVGLDSVRETRVSTVPNTLAEGTWLTPRASRDSDADSALDSDSGSDSGDGNWPVVIGRGVAQRLRVGLGDEVVFLGQAADGSIAAELFDVSGIVETGSEELDSATAFARIEDLQELLALDSRVHRIVIRLTDPKHAASLGTELGYPLADPDQPAKKGAFPVEWWSWQALNPGLVDSIEADKAGDAIFRAVLVLVALLGLVNTMLMSVFERTRELGILAAIGTTPARILGLVVAEGWWLTLLGVGLGAATGAFFNAYFATDGIVFTDTPLEFGGIAFDRMFSANTWRSTFLYPLVFLVGGLLAGVWPAWRAARMDPTRAIREA